MTCKTVVLAVTAVSICPPRSDFYVVSRPLPVVSILITFYVAASVLLHPPGDHLHVHSSLALPNSSAALNPMLQRPGPSASSRRCPPVVEVPALDDKKALYTARRPERASDKAKCIKNPKWWAHAVLFLCFELREHPSHARSYDIRLALQPYYKYLQMLTRSRSGQQSLSVLEAPGRMATNEYVISHPPSTTHITLLGFEACGAHY
ncbi:hypothetical protein EV702DRAFT_1048393 [Suillus placidus]|uniref:Uncharacterized protein n=1 Tax=Suillus placidus TaxID=48579 RepID=A0A9P6ZNW6_9AGAM|nr:hypothetical protein EV702DRAFT_1048393 [Suillus placidus]